jgi:hypothetical protein
MNGASRRWYSRGWAIALLLAVVLVLTGLITVRALGLRSLSVDAEPMSLPARGLDYSWWDGALGRWAQPDGVAYEAVLGEEAELRRFIATLASTGPVSAPERFPTEPEQLAYYINAYNALTVFAVVDNWPIETVHDVRGWLDPRPGFGFFYGLRLPLDGREINLYDLENGVIRGYLDARIHAAINCASKSCPALAPYAFEPAELDAQLDAVTRTFCSNAPHVVIDEEAREIRLSAIFDWYKADFEEHARRLGRPATVEDFIAAFASSEIAKALDRARQSDFEVVFVPYNWSLNQL